MKVIKEQLQVNWQVIVEVVLCLYCECGLEGVGVVEIMCEVGFIYGGFYGYFDFKDVFVVEVVVYVLVVLLVCLCVWFDCEQGDVCFYFEYYLCVEYCDVLGLGCVMFMLVVDVVCVVLLVVEVIIQGIGGYL